MDREKKRRWALTGLLLAGGLMRLAMIEYPRSLDDDTAVYAELGRNLLHYGTYGFLDDGVVSPALIRLPGYPLFLALLGGHLEWALVLQSSLDMLGVTLLARFLWRWAGEKVGDLALGLGALCVFTAAYAATGLTESLSVFAVMLGIWGYGQMMLAKAPGWRGLLPVAGAGALAMLLRPDGVLLLAALAGGILWNGRERWGLARTLRAACMVALLAILPLVPWTVRNWQTFHVVQPLAPRHVNDPGEPVNLGFYRWLRTWSVEFVSTGNIFWQVGEGRLEVENLPPRAYDSPEELARTTELFAAYNAKHGLTPQLDAGFAQLAEKRIAAHPLRYYLWVPVLRVADMWLRPRTETYHLHATWWHVREHPRDSLAAIALGLLGLAYVVAGALGFARRLVPFGAWMLAYMLARSLLLATVENPEPRYTIEAYPMLIVGAACWLGGRYGGRWGLRSTVQAGESDLAELFAESFPVPESGGLEPVERQQIGDDGARG